MYSSTSSAESEDFDVQFFQCTPPPRTAKSKANPFKPVLDSMRRFTPASTLPVQKPLGNGDVSNNQSYVLTSDAAEEGEEITAFENEEMINKSYKSFTRILSIPHGGFKIITEIKREDSCDKPDCLECKRKTNHVGEEWMNRAEHIEVTLSDGDQNEVVVDGGSQ
jgi:hypothetical protein